MTHENETTKMSNSILKFLNLDIAQPLARLHSSLLCKVTSIKRTKQKNKTWTTIAIRNYNFWISLKMMHAPFVSLCT